MKTNFEGEMTKEIMNKRKYRRTLSLLLALGSLAGTIQTPVLAQSEVGEPAATSGSAADQGLGFVKNNNDSVSTSQEEQIVPFENAGAIPAPQYSVPSNTPTEEGSAALSEANPEASRQTEVQADLAADAAAALNGNGQTVHSSADQEASDETSKNEARSDETKADANEPAAMASNPASAASVSHPALDLNPGKNHTVDLGQPEIPAEKTTTDGNTTTQIVHNRTQDGQITSWTKTSTTTYTEQSLPEGWHYGLEDIVTAAKENGVYVETIIRTLLDANGKVIGKETTKRYETEDDQATPPADQIIRTETHQEEHLAAGGNLTVSMSEVTKTSPQGDILGAEHELTHSIGNATLEVQTSDHTRVDLALTVTSSKSDPHQVTIEIALPDGTKQTADVQLTDGKGQYTLKGIVLSEQEKQSLSVTLSGDEIKAILNGSQTDQRIHSTLDHHTGPWQDTFRSASENKLGDAGNFSIFARNIHWNGDAEGNFAADHLYAGADFGFDTEKHFTAKDANGKDYPVTLKMGANRNHDQVDFNFSGISYFNHYENNEIKLHNTDSYLIAGDGYGVEVIENGNSVDYYLIEKANPEKKIKITNGKDSLKGIFTASDSHKIDFNQELEKLTSYSMGLRDHVKNSGDEKLQQSVKDLRTQLENQATARKEEPWKKDIIIDCNDESLQSVLRDGTYYIDLDVDSMATLLNENPERAKMYIKNLKEDQRIVFNLANLKAGENYSLQRFIDINSNPYSQWDPMSGRVMLNFGDFAGIINLVKSSVGSILAPKATVNVNETHVGNIIADTVNGTNSKDRNPGLAAGGEIHYAQSKWDNPSITGQPDPEQPPAAKPARLMTSFEMFLQRPTAPKAESFDSMYSVFKTEYKPKAKPQPEKPGTEEPEKPGTEEPEKPGTEEPEKPGTEEPEKPGTDQPKNENPGTPDPEKPQPGDPQPQNPVQPQNEDPQKTEFENPAPSKSVTTDSVNDEDAAAPEPQVPSSTQWQDIKLQSAAVYKAVPAMTRKADTGKTVPTGMDSKAASWMAAALLSASILVLGLFFGRKKQNQN